MATADSSAALPNPRIAPTIMPENAEGTMMFRIVSHFVAPSASAALFKFLGYACNCVLSCALNKREYQDGKSHSTCKEGLSPGNWPEIDDRYEDAEYPQSCGYCPRPSIISRIKRVRWLSGAYFLR